MWSCFLRVLYCNNKCKFYIILFDFQVQNLLSGVDPNFIKKFIPRMDLVGLSCFPVSPNCHRVTEVNHGFARGYPLCFVSIFLFLLSKSLVLIYGRI